MNNQSDSNIRCRAEILADIIGLPAAIQGTLSPYTVTTSSGNKLTYYNLQFWNGEKNVSMHVPNTKLDEFRQAVENGKKAKDLLQELSARDSQTILSASDALKKRSTR